MNINRGVALLIWSTHSHLCSALVEEREVAGEGGGSAFWYYLLSFGASILRKLLLGFPRINLCCSCDSVSFNDPTYMLLV